MVSTETLLIESRCVFHVSSEKGGSTMRIMNHDPYTGRHQTEIERLSLIEKELHLMRHHIFDVIERSDHIGDAQTVSILYRLSYALDESISFLEARTISLHFGED